MYCSIRPQHPLRSHVARAHASPHILNRIPSYFHIQKTSSNLPSIYSLQPQAPAPIAPSNEDAAAVFAAAAVGSPKASNPPSVVTSPTVGNFSRVLVVVGAGCGGGGGGGGCGGGELCFAAAVNF